MIKTAVELRDELITLGIGSEKLGEESDDKYFCPSSIWLQRYLDFLMPGIQEILRNLQAASLARGESEPQQMFDCDNVTRRVMDRATDYLLQNSDVPPTCDHAIFAVKLNISIFGEPLNGFQGEHATNIVRTSDRGWLFAEGQRALLADVAPRIADRTVRVRWIRFGL